MNKKLVALLALSTVALASDMFAFGWFSRNRGCCAPAAAPQPCCPAPQPVCCPAPRVKCCPPRVKCCPQRFRCCPRPVRVCCPPKPVCCPAPVVNCCPRPACPPKPRCCPVFRRGRCCNGRVGLFGRWFGGNACCPQPACAAPVAVEYPVADYTAAPTSVCTQANYQTVPAVAEADQIITNGSYGAPYHSDENMQAQGQAAYAEGQYYQNQYAQQPEYQNGYQDQAYANQNGNGYEGQDQLPTYSAEADGSPNAGLDQAGADQFNDNLDLENFEDIK